MNGGIHFFQDGPLSQGFPSLISLDGVVFDCAEQAMMHGKALLFGDAETAERILSEPDPALQQGLGRQVEGFDQALWDARKVNLVLRISRAKFKQNRALRAELFRTGDAMLAEASPHDRVWGVGLPADRAAEIDPQHWPGENWLGRILTHVREEMGIMFAEEVWAMNAGKDATP